MREEMTLIMQGRIFQRSLLLQSFWNFERMQNLGFAFAIEPWLEFCFKDQEDLRAARLRHQEYFNTQPYMAGLVLGMVCALEQEIARAPREQREGKIERLKALKNGAGGALAGIGDALFWATLRPFCAAAALVCALLSWKAAGAGAFWAGVAVYLAAYNAPALYLRWNGIRQGYVWKEEIALKLKQFPWQKSMKILRGLGLALVLVGAAALFVISGYRGVGGAVFLASLALKPWSVPAGRLYAAVCFLGCIAAGAGWLQFQ